MNTEEKPKNTKNFNDSTKKNMLLFFYQPQTLQQRVTFK